MKQPTQEQLLAIAQDHLHRNMPTLQARNSDSLDFYEVGVWNIEAALKAAYELGANDARQEAAEDAAAEDL